MADDPVRGVPRRAARRGPPARPPASKGSTADRRRIRDVVDALLTGLIPQRGRRPATSSRCTSRRSLPGRCSSAPTTSSRSPISWDRSTSFHGDDRKHARAPARGGEGRRLGRPARPDRHRAVPGDLPSRVPVVRRRPLPAGRPPVRRPRLLLPPRAQPRPRAHAGLPHARARLRRHPRSARWRTATRGSNAGCSCSTTSGSTVDAGAGQRPVLRPGRARCSPPTSASDALKFEGRHADLLGREADRDHVVQLPRRPLRCAVRDRDRRRRDRAQLRASAFGVDRITLALLARPRSRPATVAVVDPRALCARETRTAPDRPPRPTHARRCTQATGSGSRPTATSISGSRCCTRSASTRSPGSASR